MNVNNSKIIEANRPSIDTHLVSTLIITTPNGIGIKPIRLATKSEWSVNAYEYHIVIKKINSKT